MKLWFIGQGDFAARCLQCLTQSLDTQIKIEQVVTGQPRKSGRGMKETPSPVETMALQLGFPDGAIKRTDKLAADKTLIAQLTENPPDAIFVIDFGQLVKEPFLSTPKWGCLNIHPSLLPRWRGAAPIPRAILSGDVETGVTVFQLVNEMDAGPVLRQASLPIEPTTTANDLYGQLGELGAKIAAEGLVELMNAGPNATKDSFFTPQDNALATHAEKLQKQEFEIHWDWPAEKIDRSIRGLNAAGGTFVLWNLDGEKPQRLKLWRVTPVNIIKKDATPGTVVFVGPQGPIVACGTGALRLDEVQAEGKRRTSGADWARGVIR